MCVGDYSWVEVDRRFILYYIQFTGIYFILLFHYFWQSTWQLLLVSCNAKVIQLSCYNSSFRGTLWCPIQMVVLEVFGVSRNCVLDYIFRGLLMYVHGLTWKTLFSQLILFN